MKDANHQANKSVYKMFKARNTVTGAYYAKGTFSVLVYWAELLDSVQALVVKHTFDNVELIAVN